jgi:hypothetical protein
MPRHGGTRPLPISELTSDYARYIRRNTAAQLARDAYFADKAPSAPRRPKAKRRRPKPVPAPPPIPANTPPNLQPWARHLARVRASNPGLSLHDAMIAAKETFYQP